jgi:phage shock protein A
MIARLKRLLRAIFGSWLENIENPELILKQNIRDLNDQIPKMNENIAMVRANVLLLENEKSKIAAKHEQFVMRIRAALQANRRDLALNFATTLEEVIENQRTNLEQLEVASVAFERALQVKQAFLKEKERRTREAIAAIRAAEQARWQRRLADAIQDIESGGLAQTHEDMIQRIEEKAAKDKAYLDIAMHSPRETFTIEEEVKKLEANEIVTNMERELGLKE